MKLGLIARCDDKGLGVMTWEAYRHLRPAKTLVVRVIDAERAGFVQHVERYPDATVVDVDRHTGELPERVVREFLDGLDVVYSAETMYDHRLFGWAREAGARTVLHAMPEFWRADVMRPDVVWAPTSWRFGTLPPDTRLVPVPVALDRFPLREHRDEPLTFLHRAGSIAPGDRNGTGIVLSALQHLKEPTTVRLSQQCRTSWTFDVPAHVTTEWVEPPANYWDGYDADVLLMPRRYGGLSLPINEAAAAGLGLVLSDVPPNRQWPGVHIDTNPAGRIRTLGHIIDRFNVAPLELAGAMDVLSRSPEAVRTLQREARAWAEANSWEALMLTYRDELARACR